LRRIPARVVASLNTHDMPPFAAFWEGLDLADRRALGLIPRARLGGEYRRRERVRRSLARLLGRGGRAGTGESAAAAVFRATVRHLGASAARWVLLNLEDLWQETASQNTPGTSTERVNWRRKARFTLEQVRGSRGLRESLRELSLLR
jgi:4-alpha-glucanotransferase